MNYLLRKILETKRPTKDPIFCFDFMVSLLESHGLGYQIDKHLNIAVIIGTAPITMFTSHTDTVDKQLGTNLLNITTNYVRVKNGGILGADCGAGIYIMLRMIMAEVPGLYIFFSQEEQGRIGSEQCTLNITGIQHCISFDRKGTCELITHQMGEEGCSKEFAEYFEQNFPLPYYSDPTGCFTDSYSFFDQIPECTNLSVGYYQQHSKQEYLDLIFLEELVEACIEFNWSKLPSVRNPKSATWNWDKQSNTTEDMEDFCERFPEVAAAVLKAYGVTLDDLISYAYAPNEDDYYANQDHYFNR